MDPINFVADVSEFRKLANMLGDKKYKAALQKAVARYLGDMAWEFKKIALKALESTYAIRDKNFVENKAFTVKRPKASAPIDKQEAIAASLRMDDGKGGLFTGWEEEITGAPREMRAKSGRYHRLVWGKNAREGGGPDGRMPNQYWLGASSDGIPDSRDFGLPTKNFLAMLYKSMEPKKVKNEFDYLVISKGRKRKKHYVEYHKGTKRILGKNKLFIMGGDGDKYERGLYTFKDGKVKALQTFKEQPVKSEVGKFDWRAGALAEVEKKFTPKYIWDKYLLPLAGKLLFKK